MKYIVTLNGKQYEVEVEKGQATAVHAANAPVAAPAAAATVAAPVAASAAAPAGGEEIICPMPGTILAVKCAAGQAMKKGDVLFILEAMKMENEIFAPHDGIVSAVYVAQSAAVDTGAVLCTL